MIEIGDFYLAKVYITYNNHLNNIYKIRPVLVIDKIGKYYKCLGITSSLKNNMDRIDVYTNYNLDKHSQIICNTAILLNDSSFSAKYQDADLKIFHILSIDIKKERRKSMNSTKSMLIKLPTIADATSFVRAATKVSDDIEVRRGRWCVDAKSLMGVLSIDTSAGITVIYPETALEFENFIKQYA